MESQKGYDSADLTSPHLSQLERGALTGGPETCMMGPVTIGLNKLLRCAGISSACLPPAWLSALGQPGHCSSCMTASVLILI